MDTIKSPDVSEPTAKNPQLQSDEKVDKININVLICAMRELHTWIKTGKLNEGLSSN